jgi:hypothetical protein
MFNGAKLMLRRFRPVVSNGWAEWSKIRRSCQQIALAKMAAKIGVDRTTLSDAAAVESFS